MNIARMVVLVLYAAILGAGGVMGFVKARSHASLISGLLSAMAAAGAASLVFSGNTWGIPLGVTLAIALFILFGYRYAIRNKKFMPSGVLAVVSLVVLLLLLLMADWTT